MRRVIVVACLALVSASPLLSAGEPSKAAAVKKLAESLGVATIKGDYAKVIDHTHDGLLKAMGGRAAAIKFTETAMKQLMAQGITIKSFTVGDPGDFLTEGDNTFVVVPTTLELGIPGGKAIGKSYLLGISSDRGKTWKFADGAGLDNKELRDQVLPKLPAKLQLPRKQPPTVINNN